MQRHGNSSDVDDVMKNSVVFDVVVVVVVVVDQVENERTGVRINYEG